MGSKSAKRLRRLTDGSGELPGPVAGPSSGHVLQGDAVHGNGAAGVCGNTARTVGQSAPAWASMPSA